MRNWEIIVPSYIVYATIYLNVISWLEDRRLNSLHNSIENSIPKRLCNPGNTLAVPYHSNQTSQKVPKDFNRWIKLDCNSSLGAFFIANPACKYPAKRESRKDQKRDPCTFQKVGVMRRLDLNPAHVE